MSDSSRRGFLILAGAAAAGAGVAAVAPSSSKAREQATRSVAVDGPIVAYVSDLQRGEVSVMMGEREVVVHDRALCASLARAFI
jgi:hypothetical protein